MGLMWRAAFLGCVGSVPSRVQGHSSWSDFQGLAPKKLTTLTDTAIHTCICVYIQLFKLKSGIDIDKHTTHVRKNLLSCPQTNSFKIFGTSFATNIPPECHDWGTKQNKIFCSLRSQHCFVPHSHSSGAVSDCDS